MRKGTIFTRKGRRAPMWTALAGAALALGAGGAWAQTRTVPYPALELKSVTGIAGAVGENTNVTLVVTLSGAVPDARESDGTTQVAATVSGTVQIMLGGPASGTNTGTADFGDVKVGDAFVQDDDGTGSSFDLSFAEGESSDSLVLQFPGDLDAVDEKFDVVVTITQVTNDGDGNYRVSLSTDSADLTASLTDVVIDDDETQTYELRLKTAPANVKEGAPTEVTLTANPDRPPFEVADIAAVLETPAGVAGTPTTTPADLSSLKLGGGTADDDDKPTSQTIAFTLANDGNRTADTYTLKAYSGPRGGTTEEASLAVAVQDIHTLPAGDKITAAATSDAAGANPAASVKEGETVYLTVTVDRGEAGYPSGEGLVVGVTAADAAQAADYAVSPGEVAIAGTGAGRHMSAQIRLEARADDDVGAEDLVLNLVARGADEANNGTGTSVGTFTIAIDDATVPQLTPKTAAEVDKAVADATAAAAGGDGLNPGESFSVAGGALFTPAPGYAVGLTASPSGDPAVEVSTTADAVVIRAVAVGTATVTVTGVASPSPSSATTSQTQADRAEVAFDVTVAGEALAVTMDANPRTIEEGGTSTVTATANRAVTAGDGPVEVSLSVVGAATLDAASITIAAGATTASATLTSTDDGVHEPDGETVTVVASGRGIDGNVSLDIAVTDNDPAPAETTYALSGPADLNLVEGRSVALTATASGAVEADTEIRIVRDGASTAGPDDYDSVAPITIKAGETTGTTTVTAAEDDEPDSGFGSPETLTLYGLVGDVQTNPVTFHLWDVAAPALPVVAQLLLAALVAVGGYRRYLRR